MTNINFPDNPSDGDRVGLQVYNATRGVWEWDALPGDTTAEDLLGPTQNLSYLAEFLVIAGGGPGGYGGNSAGGGGGAGGYTESSFLFSTETTLDVTIGAGGTAPKAGPYTNGNPSRFGNFTARGGGYASGDAIEGFAVNADQGGSGGGGDTAGSSGHAASDAISPEQGNSGGAASSSVGGGGGGAGSAGSTPNGGAGLSSSITGSSVGRAGGGGGGAKTGATGVATDGGGNGGTSGNGSGASGTANTGGGGGGGSSNLTADRGGGNGGSGIVIFKIPQELSASFSVGLTEENGGSGQTVGDYKVYTITAGTGTVTIS